MSEDVARLHAEIVTLKANWFNALNANSQVAHMWSEEHERAVELMALLEQVVKMCDGAAKHGNRSAQYIAEFIRIESRKISPPVDRQV